MKFEQAAKFIINKLQNELPAHLSYHNIAHIKDVYNAAETIGRQEGITGTEMSLLLTAALFHDAGFMRYARGHEEESCRIARQVLPAFDYDSNHIALICGMIRATRLPQTPKTHLEQILADSDLDYLGRDDFNEIGQRLFREMKALGTVGSEPEWDKIQVEFMQQHNYFTKTAVNLRSAKKQENLAQVKAQLLKQSSQ